MSEGPCCDLRYAHQVRRLSTLLFGHNSGDSRFAAENDWILGNMYKEINSFEFASPATEQG
jgi:hypothetical protein